MISLAFEGDKPVGEYPALVQMMEKYDFYSMQIYEHIPFKPSWPIVFHAANSTKRIKIGPVTVPVFLYDPLTLARNMDVLGELCGSRGILGISRGAYAADMPFQHDRSIKAVVEAVQYIQALGMRQRFIGDIYKMNRPSPISLPRRDFELYVGTSGPKLAAEVCKLKIVKGIVVDSLWNPDYARVMRRVIDSATKGSRRVQLIARPFTFIGENEVQSRARIRSVLNYYLPELAGDSPMLSAAGVSYHKVSRRDYSWSTSTMGQFTAYGTVDDVTEQTVEMLKAGVDHVCYGHPLGEPLSEVIREIGEEILPHLTSFRNG
jgi:5,10-methylenetetrahydromethanopterin reductase